MTSLRLYKRERLCSLTAIGKLFSPSADGENNHIMAYPWRAVWRVRDDGGSDWRFVISVPKRRLKKAVDRVKMRRRCREAYRLNRTEQPREIAGADIALIYVGTGLTDYPRTERAIMKIVSRIQAALTEGAPLKTKSNE